MSVEQTIQAEADLHEDIVSALVRLLSSDRFADIEAVMDTYEDTQGSPDTVIVVGRGGVVVRIHVATQRPPREHPVS